VQTATVWRNIAAYWSGITYVLAIYEPRFNDLKWYLVMYNIDPVTKFKKNYRGISKFLNTNSVIDNKFYLLVYLHGTNDRCGLETPIFWFRQTCLQRSARNIWV
jgi:hypothetical protein